MENTAHKSTLLDFAILGLIQGEALSGYRIRKTFETTALGVYSSSPGSIYPALKRMEKNGLLENIVVEGSKKQAYHISPKGIEVLKAWLKEEITHEDVAKRREILLLKFAFMEKQLSRAEAQDFLLSFQRQLEIYIEELRVYHKNEKAEMPLFGSLAFQHGIESCRATIDWCKSSLEVLKNESGI